MVCAQRCDISWQRIHWMKAWIGMDSHIVPSIEAVAFGWLPRFNLQAVLREASGYLANRAAGSVLSFRSVIAVLLRARLRRNSFFSPTSHSRNRIPQSQCRLRGIVFSSQSISSSGEMPTRKVARYAACIRC